MKKLYKKLHDGLFGTRCELKPGIKYFRTEDFPGLIAERFEFKNSNDTTLRGNFYYYDKKENKQLVLFCHGMGGGHAAYIKEINYLAKEGFLVYSFDYQGTIFSDGTKVGGFLQGLSDVDSCLNALKNASPNQKIYIVGHSWGAFNTMNVINDHKEVTKIVEMSGFNSLKQVFRDSIPNPVKFLAKGMTKIEEEMHPEYKDISSLESLKKYDGQALLMHSVDDNMVDYKNTFEIFKKELEGKPNFKFITYQNKFHNVTYTDVSVKNLNAYLIQLQHINTDAQKIKLGNKTDFNKLYELDEAVMSTISDFLKKN